jgi:hypothetical protein
MDEMFDSAVRSAGDMAGVFECDGETNFFYLYQIFSKGESTILGAVSVSFGTPISKLSDIKIIWSDDENIVGLKVYDEVCAAFDCDSAKLLFGGMQNQDKSKLLSGIIWR